MTDLLQRLGFDAVSVAGGTSGWAADGRTIVTGSTP
jgi:rhodanese-related sulfurtransferase